MCYNIVAFRSSPPLSTKKTPNAPMHFHNYSGSQSRETKQKKPEEKCVLLKQHVCTNNISYVDDSYHFVNFSTFFRLNSPKRCVSSKH